jgi:hypothetical protein
MSDTVGIHFGVLCSPIETQLREHGYTLGAKSKHIQKAVDNINFLHVNCFLSDSEQNKANLRVMKEIKKFAVKFKG